MQKRTAGFCTSGPYELLRLRRDDLRRRVLNFYFLHLQNLPQRPLKDRRHLALEIELVPPRVDRRDALARVREQRADLFQRVAFPVEDGRRRAPQIVWCPALHAELADDALRGTMQGIAREREKRRVRIVFEMGS